MKRFLFLIMMVLGNGAIAQQLAFPGAEGFGRFASGGRGGSIYHVTTLNDAGPGSFRDAVSKPKRTIVFDVAGVIKITDKIKAAADITVAGQTAPAPGITVYGNGISLSGNSIVRHMRFRGSINMPRGGCTLVADSLDKLMLDHVSIEWGRWDNLHIKHSTNVTLQYCLIAESLDPQCFGALIERPEFVTIHHCLWADNQSRNPKAKAKIEYVNNVVYNWGTSGFVGGHSAEHHYQDLVNNYFIAGPNSTDNFLAMFTATDHVYQRGNKVDLNKDGQLNGREVTIQDFGDKGASMLSKPTLLTKSNLKISTPEQAYQTVIVQAGAFLYRDAVDQRLLAYVTSLGTQGKIYRSETEVNGQPDITPGRPNTTDKDGDGIPDAWEQTHHLNANNAEDAQLINSAGYSNLEEYLNGLTKK
jgi:pectate lyase